MGDIPPNPTHHPLPSNPTLGDIAGQRSPARQMDPPATGSSDDPRNDYPRGFTRGGFAPIPHRHSDLPPSASHEERDGERARSPPPPPRDYDRERELPRRHDVRDREAPGRVFDPESDDRERRTWDDYYERTGRGPPPPPPPHAQHWEDDYGRPKRRRSPSPYDAAPRARHRSPTPPRHQPPNPGFTYPDPAEVDYVLTFRQFSEWFRASHPQTAKLDDEETRRVRAEIEGGAGGDVGKEKVGMAKRYDRYRKEYTSRQLFALYLTHGQSAWFQERYSHDPHFQAIRKRVSREGRVPTVEKYVAEMKDGKWDDVSFDDGPAFRRSSGLGGRSERDEPEALDRPLGDQHHSDDALRLEIQPTGKQVFVKTVPPTTKRVDLEELFAQIEGFQHLAITEPSIKKQFHRVAWAQYADGVDLEDVLRRLDSSKIDTFTFHLGINANAVAGRLRFTAEVANSTERLQRDAESARALALKLEEDLVDLEQNEDDAPSKPDTSLDKPARALVERGSIAVEQNVSRILEKSGLDVTSLDPEAQNRKARIVADQWISYLRHGLSTCYYCVAPTAFPEELHRKCIGHVRPDPTAKAGNEMPTAEDDVRHEDHRDGMDEDTDQRYNEDRESRQRDHTRPRFPQRTADEKWQANLDYKLRPLLQEVDNVEYGGRDMQEEAKKATAPHIRQEEPTKYRCKACQKLFKAPEFVVKHVSSKHPELIGDKLDNIPTFNNFVLDPQHITPSINTPAAIGDALPAQAGNPFADVSGNGHLNPNIGGPGDMNPGGMNMMQQQMMMMLQMQQAMMMGQMQFSPQQQTANLDGGGQGQGRQGQQGAGQNLLNRVGGYASRDADLGPLPAAPPGGEDPRARRGRVSYQDLDQPGGAGDGGLPY